MASANLSSADLALHSYHRRYSTIGVQMKGLLSIAALCLLISFLVSCGQTSEVQSNHAGGPKLVQRGSNAQLTYVALGASDTFGIGAGDPYTQNWPTDLAQLLGSNVHLINLGIPEIRVHDALSLELPVALDSHPDLVTIWLAVNDLADNVPVSSYSHDLNQLLARLQAGAPRARILIANVPDLTLLPYFDSYNPQVLQSRMQAYNAAIASIVQQHNVILVDLTQQSYNLRAHPEYVSSDGLHPTDIGYEKLAGLFYKTLQNAQKSTAKT